MQGASQATSGQPQKIRREGQGKGFTSDGLYEILVKGAGIYAGRRDADDRKAKRGDLLAAARPANFLQLLSHDRSFIVCVLAEGHSPQEMKRAAKRYGDLMRDLEKIVAALPDLSPARGQGRPPRNPKNLYATVAFLASQWECVTGEPFSQSWHTDDKADRVPLTVGAAFIHDVVKLIDPTRLREVPNTARLVRERNAGTPCWTIFSQHLRGER